MPDVCDLILDDHEVFRRRFAELDELRAAGSDAAACSGVWTPVAALLEVHAAAEEELFYPRLLAEGEQSESDEAEEQTRDAVNDHNDIRDAIKRAHGAEAASDEWWQAVLDARAKNSDHIAEEERGALPNLRLNTSSEERRKLGERWVEFRAEHAMARGLDLSDKDTDRYLRRHGAA